MKVYLNLGYTPEPGGSIGRELLEKIADVGFHGVRQDVPEDPALTRALVRELEDSSRLNVIFLLSGGHMTRRTGDPWEAGPLVRHVRETCGILAEAGLFDRTPPPALEIGNEPDLAHHHWKRNPESLAEAFTECFETVREFSEAAPVLTPSVSNLNVRGLSYLSRMLERGLPAGAAVAVHRYPNGQSPSDPHYPFPDRREEIAALLSIAGDRDVWVTETGRSEGPGWIRRFFFQKIEFWLTEQQVADYMEAELRLWADFPKVKAVVWYQLNSGADRGNELNNYGIRRVDGTFKPVAERFSTVIQEVA
jgi:hypothetical protein